MYRARIRPGARRWRPVGARRDFSHSVLNLAKNCSIGLRSGEYFGRNTRRAPIADRCAHGFPLCDPRLSRMTTSLALEGRDKKLLDIGAKALAVDGTIEQAGRIDPIVAKRGEECRASSSVPCGTLSMRRSGPSAPSRGSLVMLVFVQVSSRSETRGVMTASDQLRQRARWRLTQDDPARAQRASFFKRHADLAARKGLIIEVSVLQSRRPTRRSQRP